MDTLKPRRRWFQISLRALLIGVTLASCGFGWFGRQVRLAKQQRAAVESILKVQGQIVYDYQFDAVGKFKMDRPPPAPDWLRKRLGLDFVANLASVRILANQIANTRTFTDAELMNFQELAQLRILDLSDATITDAGLVHLEALTRLESLNLHGQQISNVGVEHLRRLTRLKTLILYNTRLTDAGLEHLQGLTQLEVLSLVNARITDEGLTRLHVFPQLQVLYLHGTQVTDVGLPSLYVFEHLKFLNLRDTPVTDRGYLELEAAMPGLTVDR